MSAVCRHLLALAVVLADVVEFPADVEQHVVLTRSELLHEVGGEHPRPEHDAVILETTWGTHTPTHLDYHYNKILVQQYW